MQTTELAVLDLHADALAATRAVVAGLGAGDWDAWIETSRTEVRRLVNHVVMENGWVEHFLAGESIDEIRRRVPADADVLGEDPLGAYDRSCERAEAALAAPGAFDVRCEVPRLGSITGREYAGSRLVDVLVHGWEVAKATGQDTRLDPRLAGAARSIIEPKIRMLAENGVIRDAVVVPPDADDQTHLLALFGFSE